MTTEHYRKKTKKNRKMHTSIAFLRIIKNFSDRCIRKRVNLWQRISSMSSDCLIRIETRTELTEASIKHDSLSDREIITGFKVNSLLCLQKKMNSSWFRQFKMDVVNSYFNSTSGLLCLSTIWEGKFRMQTAAFKVAFTVSKYGFKAPD